MSSLSDDTTFPLDRIRNETPGVMHVTHFNSAGASLPPQIVVDTVIEHTVLEAHIGGYEAHDQRRHDTDVAFYETAATLLNCLPTEVAFTDSATRAWQLGFYSLAYCNNIEHRLCHGDRILYSVSEYAANVIPFLQMVERLGVVAEAIPNDGSGQVDADALERILRLSKSTNTGGRIKIVAITHVPTNGGLVNNVSAIGKLTREYGISFIVDACQSVGQMTVDVKAIGCDMLSFTGRKFLRGPRGTGVLFVSRRLLDTGLEPLMMDMHGASLVSPENYVMCDDAKRFETWEYNVSSKLGLLAAMKYALALGTATIELQIRKLAAYLRQELSRINGVELHDMGLNLCGIISFTISNVPLKQVKASFAAERINISISYNTSTMLDMTNRNLSGIIRASVHYYNTFEEIQKLINVILKCN